MVDGDETAPGDGAFFLALAAKGKEAWNAWRRDPANKGVYVTFKGVDAGKLARNCFWGHAEGNPD